MLEKVEHDVPVYIETIEKNTTLLGSFKIKVSITKNWDFLGCFSTITFMDLPFLFIIGWEIYIRLIQWMNSPLEQASESVLYKKGYAQDVFRKEIFFCVKHIYFPTFSSNYTIFLLAFISAFFGQPQYAYVYWLSRALYYA